MKNDELYIDIIMKKTMKELKSFNPILCRDPDDPRIDRYFISITKEIYIIFFGICEMCESICIYNDPNLPLHYDIKSSYEQVYDFLVDSDYYIENDIEPFFDSKSIIGELSNYQGTVDDLIILIKSAVMQELNK